MNEKQLAYFKFIIYHCFCAFENAKLMSKVESVQHMSFIRMLIIFHLST